MPSKSLSDYRPVKLGPLLLTSIILHGIFIFILSYFYVQSSPQDDLPATLTINLKVPPSVTEPGRSNKSRQTSKNKATTQQKNDMWQKGIDTLHKLMQQPGFLEQLYEKEILPPNNKSKLFDKQKPVTQTTIESYSSPSTGEVDIVFRYPSGKTVCARMREPDPLDEFDTGSWVVVLSGCK